MVPANPQMLIPRERATFLQQKVVDLHVIQTNSKLVGYVSPTKSTCIQRYMNSNVSQRLLTDMY